MNIDRKNLLKYACEKFENKMYDEALEIFVLAYMKGYEKEWVLENIYECYVSANEPVFRKAYSESGKENIVPYELCTLDFIPYKEGEYFIFDKEMKIFRGTYVIPNLENNTNGQKMESPINAEFSALSLGMEWNWGAWNFLLKEVQKRKVYVVCEDIKRGISFCKIPELQEYMDKIVLFSNLNEYRTFFHQNTEIYLPKVFAGEESMQEKLREISEEEHKYRLTPAGRNVSNVLLTIAIPTHDRGNLVLKHLENLLLMEYDAEIEIAISKNGTTFYQQEYKQIEKIPDARIKYKGYDKELFYVQNWENVIQMSNGKFVLLVSDEDNVVISNLEHYLKLLDENDELALVRSKTLQQYAHITESNYYKKGNEAFLAGFLAQNYISGAIFSRDKFLNANIDFWDTKYKDNTFYYYYPHQWWQVIMSFLGDYAVDNLCLIEEGESVVYNEQINYGLNGKKELCEAVEHELLVVSTYESRIAQFKAALDLIEEYKLNDDLIVQTLAMLINKTIYLMDLVRRDYHYKVEKFPNAVEDLIKEIMIAFERFRISIEVQKFFLQGVMQCIAEIESEVE